MGNWNQDLINKKAEKKYFSHLGGCAFCEIE